MVETGSILDAAGWGGFPGVEPSRRNRDDRVPARRTRARLLVGPTHGARTDYAPPSMLLRATLVCSTSAMLALVGCATGLGGPIDGEGGAGGAPSTSSPTGTTTSSTGTTSTSSASGGGGTAGEGGAGTTSTTSSTTTSTTTSSSTGSGGGSGDVFFSEYVEGSSNNKALEIVNLRSTSLSLSSCVIERYSNGGSTPTNIALQGGSLPPGGVFVICNPSFAQPGLCDQTNTNINHNGDDALVLVCGGTTLDVFGRVGEQLNWGNPPTSAVDATLRRKCTVTSGDTNEFDAFDPAVQWNGFAIDTFSNLGLYDCP
jgi:uncharacterized protein